MTFELRKSDWIILVIVIATLAAVYYDLSHLDKIEDRCVDECNVFWIDEFNSRCNNDLIKKGDPFILNVPNYTINKT